ncbi:uncharacterized protein DUF1593 [Neolewinella xylanilytica]|uniref:Uncharacterized protein DUF1593 n=1 Tax=Neolewinella xylanilytica TaxID=1514080 RepID=A0A2S6I8Q5_9BACT|nr:DUF1593 domain-containing protein [Neolewinella xylanilytica]PPK87859.1 uncharacterized protein DUF1593 [Neolewinella xylanilytica]
MQKTSIAINCLLLVTLSAVATGQAAKPLVIITQDGEVDDRSSFVRFLLYTSDVDVRGIIATNSKWQQNGHGLGWIGEAYRVYGVVRDNLLLHDPDYPTVDYLESITVRGNEDPDHLTGAPPYADSEGADLIVRELLALDDELLHLNCWGGVNTVAHALWKFRNDHPEAYAQKAAQVRVITIDFQDAAGDWIVANLPEIRVIRNNAFHMTWNYHGVDDPLAHNPYPKLMSRRWLSENVKNGHGPLGAWYPQDNVSEGDTPAFLNFVDNGLEAYADYALGGWGGRYGSVRGNYWMDAADDGNPHKTLWRWIPDVQHDFAARADWSVKSYEDANHSPVIEATGTDGVVQPGQQVSLTARATDPDGDAVYYYWWHYPDPSGMAQPLKIDRETAADASFTVPDMPNGPLYIILEVQDDGMPSLKRYRRLTFTVEK